MRGGVCVVFNEVKRYVCHHEHTLQKNVKGNPKNTGSGISGSLRSKRLKKNHSHLPLSL